MTATVNAGRAEGPRDRHVRGFMLSRDARILRQAMYKALSTSPEAFLRKASEIAAKPPDYWEGELRSSTWAVMHKRNKVLGIAATKRPGDKDCIQDKGTARFIESVWIDPDFRRKNLGKHLVDYLIDEERRKSVDTDRFFLWVFLENCFAIKLYTSMEFKPTGREQQPEGADVTEALYVLRFDSSMPLATELQAHEAAREDDWLEHGVRYRLLRSDG